MSNDTSFGELTLEQQFNLKSFETQVKNINDLEGLQELLLEVYKQGLIKENMYKSFMKDAWQM